MWAQQAYDHNKSPTRLTLVHQVWMHPVEIGIISTQAQFCIDMLICHIHQLYKSLHMITTTGLNCYHCLFHYINTLFRILSIFLYPHHSSNTPIWVTPCESIWLMNSIKSHNTSPHIMNTSQTTFNMELARGMGVRTGGKYYPIPQG